VFSIETVAAELRAELGNFLNLQQDFPRLAKDPQAIKLLERAVRSIPTSHALHRADAREFAIAPGSVALVLTSPPYWTLKRYRDSEGQLGHLEDYELFLSELDEVWRRGYDALVPGGRLVCVVGDVCLSRRRHGRHRVIPLHASIQEHCRGMGFDNLAPIFWHKISNAKHEVDRGSGGFLGKPYEPNSVVKNDVEFILMFRKPGGYRNPSTDARLLSLIPEANHRRWFQQVWIGLAGASTRHHPAPFPLELAERLVRMFSFVGDTVLDPFAGTGTTNLAAALWGRNSIGIEIDETYLTGATERLRKQLVDAAAEVLEIHADRISEPKPARQEVTSGVSAA
jgi:DNA modification methylase